MAGLTLGPDHDLAIRLQKVEDAVKDLATRDVLQAANIGAGGLTVNGGNITIASGGSLIVTGTGTISLATGTFNANLVTSNTDVNATGNVNAGSNVNAPNGTLVSPYARAHTVTSGYVSAWINSDGSVLATASAARYKRDIEDFAFPEGSYKSVRLRSFRWRIEYIKAMLRGLSPEEAKEATEKQLGVIAEEMLEAGLDELVVLDDKGRTFSVHYAFMGLLAIQAAQELAAETEGLRTDLAATQQEVRDLAARVTDLLGR